MSENRTHTASYEPPRSLAAQAAAFTVLARALGAFRPPSDASIVRSLTAVQFASVPELKWSLNTTSLGGGGGGGGGTTSGTSILM